MASYTDRRHEAVVRVLNPGSFQGEPVRWQDVGGDRFERRSDLTWRELDSDDIIEEPLTGTVDHLLVQGMLPYLPGNTICVAQWVGYGSTATYPRTAHRAVLPPGRESLAWAMPRSEIGQARVPMRWWHPDLEWVAGNDIYARSLFVSGPENLASALLATPALEAYRVSFEDRVVAEDF